MWFWQWVICKDDIDGKRVNILRMNFRIFVMIYGAGLDENSTQLMNFRIDSDLCLPCRLEGMDCVFLECDVS